MPCQDLVLWVCSHKSGHGSRGWEVQLQPQRDSVRGPYPYSTRDAPEPPGCGKFGFPSLFLASFI